MAGLSILLYFWLVGGLLACLTEKLPLKYIPIAMPLIIYGLTTFVCRDMWLRMTGRGKQADEAWIQIFLEDHQSLER